MRLTSLRTIHHVGIRLLLIVGLFLVSQPGGLRAGAQDEEFERYSRQVDSYMGEIEALRERLDRARFDLEELSFELAFEDAETIAAWVRESIAYEAYPGLLRGARGTLIDGAGNALDQAVLLATLLRDAGFDAEIRLTELNREDAEALVSQMQSRDPTTIDVGSDAPFGVDGDQLEQAQSDAEALVASLESEAAEVAEALLARLQLSDGSIDRVIAEAQRYAWVEYRLGSDDAWTLAHPAFESATAPADLVAAESLTDEVPAELQHRFRVQAWIERKVGDRLEAVPIMDAWERPAANLVGEAITFTTFPDGFGSVEDPSDGEAILEATNFFFPIFEDDLAPGGRAFDLLGNVAPPDAAASSMAGVFQSVASNLGSALDTLNTIGGDDESDPAITLTAQWLEFTQIAPGGGERVHRRYVFDRIGAENRARNAVEIGVALEDAEVLDALQTAQTFMLAPGRYSTDYVADRGLAMTLASRSFLDGTLDAIYREAAAPQPSAELVETQAASVPLNLFSLFDSAPLAEGVVSYRPSPALMVVSQRVDGGGALIDIVANPRRSFETSGGGELPTPDPMSSLMAGVWETRSETLPFEVDGLAVFGTIPALERATEAGVALVGLAPGDDLARAELDLPSESLAAIAEDLEHGYAVLAPQALAPGEELAAWWRVDLATGETLGRGLDGRGPGFVEFLTTFEVSLTITAAFAVGGAAMCMSGDASDRDKGCCLVQNVVLAGVGVGIGVLLAAKFASAAILIFIGMDLGYNTVGLFLPTFCPG